MSYILRRSRIITSHRLCNHLLSSVEHYQYLDIIIEVVLHIQLITSKANQMFGLLKCNLRTPSAPLRESTYFSLVHPKLEYITTVWNPHLAADQITLEKVKRHAARYVKNVYANDASVTQVVNELKWKHQNLKWKNYFLKGERSTYHLCLSACIIIPATDQIMPYFQTRGTIL